MVPRILYIEDNIDNLVLVRRILQAEGFDMLEATSAAEGIALAQETLPDIILMDINMPEMDGLSATLTLRQLPGLEDTPIVAVTANIMRGVLDDMLAAGCNGYIAKPIQVDSFPDQVLSYLNNGRTYYRD